MASLFESGELFEASTMFEYAAECIELLAKGENLDDEEKATLKEAGQLLTRVDWRETGWEKSSVSPEIAVQASRVRPSFYATLLRTRETFSKAGLEKDEDVISFLRSLYSILTNHPKLGDVPPLHFELGGAFLKELSRDLFLEINHNGSEDPEPVFGNI